MNRESGRRTRQRKQEEMASLKAEVTLAQLHASTSSTPTSVSYISFLVLCIVRFSPLIY